MAPSFTLSFFRSNFLILQFVFLFLSLPQVFIEIDRDDDPVLEALVERRLRKGAVLVLSSSKAGVDARVSVARALDCIDGWYWYFIDI